MGDDLQQETFNLIKDLGLKAAEADFVKGGDKDKKKQNTKDKQQNRKKSSKKDKKEKPVNAPANSQDIKSVTTKGKRKNNSSQDNRTENNSKVKGKHQNQTAKKEQKRTNNSSSTFKEGTKSKTQTQKSTNVDTKKEGVVKSLTPTKDSSVQPGKKKKLNTPPEQIGQNKKAKKGSGGPFAELDDEITKWYELPGAEQGCPRGLKKAAKDPPDYLKPNAAQLDKAEAAAARALEAEGAAREKSAARRADGDDRWLEQVLRSGTLSDKVAALALAVQRSPVHALPQLDQLLKLAEAPQQRTAQLAGQALQDLWRADLLPPGRRLRAFRAKPYPDPGWAGPALALRAFEDGLRERYGRFLKALRGHLGHTVAAFKRWALGAAAELLGAHPEREGELLAMLVNKLGDPERRAAAAGAHRLRELLRAHPGMKGVVAREVQQFLHRPNLQPRAVHAAIAFLNQMYFTKEDGELVSKLVSTYLTLFERSVKRLEEAQEAEKHAAARPGKNKKGKKKKKKKKGKPAPAAAAAEGAGAVEARLLSALLSGVHRAHPYLPQDFAEGRLAGHLGALLRTARHPNHRLAVQALLLLHQMVAGRPAADPAAAKFRAALRARLAHPQLHAAGRPLLLLNLVYRAARADPDPGDLLRHALRAFGRGGAAGAAGAVFLAARALGQRADAPALRRALFGPDHHAAGKGSAGEGEEAEAEAEAEAEEVEGEEEEGTKQEGAPSGEAEESDGPDEAAPGGGGGGRAAAAAPAPAPPLWEAAALAQHYHPAVSRFARGLLQPPDHAVEYTGDPLADFGPMAFLDRLAYKGQKAKMARRAEHMRRAAAEVARQQQQRRRRGAAEEAEGGAAAAAAAGAAGGVAEEGAFFRAFFEGKARREAASGKKKKKDERDEDVLADIEDEEEEEAFAARLAEGLLKGARGHQPDFDDDEVPDLGNLSSDDEEGGKPTGGGDMEEGDDDVDAFMDGADSDDDDHDFGGMLGEDGEEDDEGFEEDEAALFGFGGKGEVSDSDEDDDKENPSLSKKAAHKEKKKKRKEAAARGAAGGGGDFFASADDFEGMIEEDLQRDREAAAAEAARPGQKNKDGGENQDGYGKKNKRKRKLAKQQHPNTSSPSSSKPPQQQEGGTAAARRRKKKGTTRS